jgi:hypothetical protein
MNTPADDLHEALERLRRPTGAARADASPASDSPETQTLAALARALQQAPALQVDPAFANQLERRLLARQAALARRQKTSRWWAGVSPRFWRAHPARLALSLALVVVLLASGILVAAAQVTNPNNPLYALKHWEQQVQSALAGPSTDQAEADLQAARNQLQALPALATSAQAGPYRRALAAFDQHLRQAQAAIAALPAGPDHDRLAGELASLQAQARATLRGLLQPLAVPERQATTDELGRLGAAVPRLTRAEVSLPAHPNGQASIRFSGESLQAGATLLVDGRPVTARGVPQPGGYLFTLTWKGEQHPHSLGLMNQDGMVAQTTALTYTISESTGAGGGNGNGNGTGTGGGNGNGSGTDTGGNGNGMGSGKGGGAPASTPTSHRELKL